MIEINEEAFKIYQEIMIDASFLLKYSIYLSIYHRSTYLFLDLSIQLANWRTSFRLKDVDTQRAQHLA